MICHKLSHLCGLSPHELGKAVSLTPSSVLVCNWLDQSHGAQPSLPAVPVTLTGHRLYHTWVSSACRGTEDNHPTEHGQPLGGLAGQAPGPGQGTAALMEG